VTDLRSAGVPGELSVDSDETSSDTSMTIYDRTRNAV
jgi:hypothetical protein